MGLVGRNEKNQIFEKINYFFNSIIGLPAQLKKTRGAFFQLLFFQLSIISESWRGVPGTLFQTYFRCNGQNRGKIGGASPIIFFQLQSIIIISESWAQGIKNPLFFFVPTTINYCHAAVNERNRQESLFFFQLIQLSGGPANRKKKVLNPAVKKFHTTSLYNFTVSTIVVQLHGPPPGKIKKNSVVFSTRSKNINFSLKE